jgi:hypothetical protein
MSYNHFKSPKRYQPIPTLVENPALKQPPVPCEQVVNCDLEVYGNISNLMRSNAPWHEIETAAMQAQPAAVPWAGSTVISRVRDSNGRGAYLDQQLKTTSMEALPSVGTSRLTAVSSRLNARRDGKVLDVGAGASRFPAL